MRKLISIIFVAGCAMHYDSVSVIRAHDGPLPVGSDESFSVLQDRSSDAGDPDVVVPDNITVTVADEGVARLVRIDRAKGTFLLHGVSPGTTRVTVTGNAGITADQDVSVR